MIDNAAAVAGISISDKDKEMMLRNLNDQVASYEAIRTLALKNSDQMALVLNPVVVGDTKPVAQTRPRRLSRVSAASVPKNLEQLAFFTVRELAELVRTRKVSATALTEMYIERMKRYNPLLKFAITLTTERALDQAKAADREIAAGRYRGPLHGIPWGAKDLLGVKGYPTTWGAGGLEAQVIDEDATVVQRLDGAGAILIAKLTLGALAMGDKWFGGMTRSPWRPDDQGSSGSSAGSASAVAAGCVAFAIGSETLGSIASPSSRCGATGLRPTFGFVPRTGAMTLAWTWDKLGPICRAVEDCALVMEAVHGPDGKDISCVGPATFSFNVKGGRCEECAGDGTIVTQLSFMPDVEVICPACKGRRYREETLEVTWQGRNIAEVLKLSIEESVSFFRDQRPIVRKLEVLHELGLGYLELGHAATILSGGEAQRVKLAAELGKMRRGRHNLYILDEPTTGLHLADIQRLLDCLQRLLAGRRGQMSALIQFSVAAPRHADGAR
jgi:hypothetical protein